MSGVGYARGAISSRIGAALALLLLATVMPVADSAIAQDADPFATRVQFLHAATDAKELEVHINNDEVLDEFGYGDVSDWIEVDPGTVRLTITADRAGFNYILFDGGYPVPAGNDYFVVITEASIVAGVFDQSAAPADTGRVQVTHASIASPALNIVVSGTDQTFTVSYSQTSEALDLPVGAYDLDFQLAETGESVGSLTGFTVAAGSSYQLVAIGDPTSSDQPFEVKVLETTASTGGEATPAATPVATPAG